MPLLDMFRSSDVETLLAKRDVRGLIRALKNDDQNVRDFAIPALGLMGDARAVGPLMALLKEEPTLVADALVRLGGPAMDPLIAALSDADKEVRRISAEALGAMGNVQAVSPLIEALQDADREVCAAAAKALGRLGDARAVEPLISLMQGGADEALCQVVVNVLGQLKDGRAVGPLVQLLKSADLDVRWAAIEVLGQLGELRAAESLTAVLLDPDRDIRELAAKALDQLGWLPGKDEAGVAYWVAKRWWSRCVEYGSLAVAPLALALQAEPYGAADALEQIGEPAVEPLINALQSDNKDIRRAAAKALGAIGDLRAVEPLIDILRDTDKHTRLVIVGALGQLGDARAIEPLVNALRVDDLRDVASKALMQLGTAQVASVLMIVLQDTDQHMRLAAVNILGKIGDKRAVKPLIALLGDSDSTLCQATAEALGGLGDPRAIEPLAAALVNMDPNVRRTVALALGELKDIHAVEPLIASLKDSDENVRMAAGEALAKFGEVVVPQLITALRDEQVCDSTATVLMRIGAPAVEPLIATLQQDSDVSLRRTAIDILGQLKDSRALGAIISFLKDEELRYSAAEALSKIGAPPALRSLIKVFQENEQLQMLTALKDLCEAYVATNTNEITRLEPIVRHIGEELNRRGGLEEMRCLFEQLGNRNGSRYIATVWEGVGDWHA